MKVINVGVGMNHSIFIVKTKDSEKSVLCIVEFKAPIISYV